MAIVARSVIHKILYYIVWKKISVIILGTQCFKNIFCVWFVVVQTILDGDLDGLELSSMTQVSQSAPGKLQVPSIPHLFSCGLVPPLNVPQSSVDQRSALMFNDYDWVREWMLFSARTPISELLACQFKLKGFKEWGVQWNT